MGPVSGSHRAFIRNGADGALTGRLGSSRSASPASPASDPAGSDPSEGSRQGCAETGPGRGLSTVCGSGKGVDHGHSEILALPWLADRLL